MFRFDEDKAYIDSVDGQMVALMTESGIYCTFNSTAEAVLKDLDAGYAPEEIEKVLRQTCGSGFSPESLTHFVEEVLDKGILKETAECVPAERPAMACEMLRAENGDGLPELEEYDDVAAYFMIDPIHEADPELGWPYAKDSGDPQS